MPGQAMKPRPRYARSQGFWESLQANSQHPAAQARIRDAIRRGLIRVLPDEGGKVRLVPLHPPRPHVAPQARDDPARDSARQADVLHAVGM